MAALKHDAGSASGKKRWQVRGLYSTREKDGLVKCDLTDNAEIEKQFMDFQPDVVIHSAAERRPDVVFKKPELARTLNVEVSENLALACQKYNSMIIFFSTDYIFDGKNPPYAVDAQPNPLSTYGEQKVAGENLCLQWEKSLVLRVPLLFGPMDYPKESGVTATYDDLQNGKIVSQDHTQKRYPTYTRDIARILVKILDTHFGDGPQLSGKYHFQSNECLTKYEMLMALADVVGTDASDIKASLADLPFPVPMDSRLDCSRLEKALNISSDDPDFRTPFKEALEVSMQEYLGAETLSHMQKEKAAKMSITSTETPNSSSTETQISSSFGTSPSVRPSDNEDTSQTPSSRNSSKGQRTTLSLQVAQQVMEAIATEPVKPQDAKSMTNNGRRRSCALENLGLEDNGEIDQEKFNQLLAWQLNEQ